jgi:hypothetical protein
MSQPLNPVPLTAAELAAFRARQKSRSRALALVLIAIVVLFFAITLVKLRQEAALGHRPPFATHSMAPAQVASPAPAAETKN